jgi:hypothetical protein
LILYTLQTSNARYLAVCAARDDKAIVRGFFFQHLRVGREFFDEHEQALNRFFDFMARQATSDQIELKLVMSL